MIDAEKLVETDGSKGLEIESELGGGSSFESAGSVICNHTNTIDNTRRNSGGYGFIPASLESASKPAVSLDPAMMGRGTQIVETLSTLGNGYYLVHLWIFGFRRRVLHPQNKRYSEGSKGKSETHALVFWRQTLQMVTRQLDHRRVDTKVKWLLRMLSLVCV